MRVFQAARNKDLPPATRSQLEELARHFDPCQRKSSRPQQFVNSLAYGNTMLNFTVAADVCYFKNGPVQHMKCLGTKTIAAGFIVYMSGAGVRNSCNSFGTIYTLAQWRFCESIREAILSVLSCALLVWVRGFKLGRYRRNRLGESDPRSEGASTWSYSVRILNFISLI